MLKVLATDEDGNVVLELEISRVDEEGPKSKKGTYSVQAGVAEPDGIRYTQRSFQFPRLRGNYIGFLEMALIALDDEFKDFPDGPLDETVNQQDQPRPRLSIWST